MRYVEFTLTYDGPLATNGSPAKKHDIRRAFHPQLGELWRHGPLNHSAKEAESGGRVQRTVGDHTFTAVVHSLWNFRAKLDILLLKPEPPGRILAPGGDIDNRLKTLFDALTVPTQPQDLPKTWEPTADEKPMHCLLEDDSMISGVSVRTDRLLGAQTSSHVKLVIQVQVSTAWTFGGFAIMAP